MAGFNLESLKLKISLLPGVGTGRKLAEEEERLARERFETLAKIYEMREASETEISEYAMEAACRMTGSTLAFIGTITQDESVMDIVAWSASAMKDCSVASSPIHFPIEHAGIWADAVRERRPKIVNDYSASNPGKKGLPGGHVGITRFLAVPILDAGRVVMVAAVSNKLSGYDDADITRLTLLMQGVWGNLQRRRTDEALHRQAEIIDQTHDSIITTNLEGNVTSWNKGAERLFGYTALEAVGRNVSFIYPEAEHEVLQSHVIAPLKKNGSHEIELRVQKKSGEHLFVHLSLSLLKDETGTDIGMIGYSLDITAKKQAEEALRQSRQILEGVLNSIPVRVFWKDKNSVYLGCNTIFARDAGFEKPEDLIGKNDYAMGWREQAELYRSDDRAVIETGKKKILYEEPQTTPAGEQIILLTSKVPLRDAGNNIIGVLGTYLDITERRKAEESVRKSLAILKGIIESPKGVVIFALDRQYRYIAFNENHRSTMKQIWGADIALGTSMLEYIGDPMDREKAIINFNRALAGESFTVIETYGDTAFERRYYEDIYNPVTDESGNVIGLTLFLTDITERRQMEDALKESEYRFRELFNSMSSGVAVFKAIDEGTDFVFVDFNHGAENIDKITKQEVVGRPVTEVFPGIKDFGLLEVFRRVWQSGTPEHFPLSLYQDERIAGWRDNYIYRLPSGEIVAIYEDITEQKKAEEALKESEKKFREIFDNVNDGIELVEIDANDHPGRFIEMNAVACRMLHYSKEELLKMGPLDIGTQNFSQPFGEIIREVNTRGHVTFQTEHRTKEGTIFPVEVNAHLVTILGRKLLLSVVRDITERKLVEEALRASEHRSATMLKALPDMMFVISREGQFRDVNVPENASLLAPTDRIIGTNVRDSWFGGETTNTILDRIEQALLTKKLQQFEYELDLTGGKRQYEARLVALTDEEVLGVVRDITEEKEAEMALRVSENRYKILFNESPIPLWEVDFSDLKEWLDAKEIEGVSDFPAYFEAHPEYLYSCAKQIRVIDINHATMALFGAASFQEFQNGLTRIFLRESYDAFCVELAELFHGKREFETEVPLRNLQGKALMVIMKVTIVPGHEKAMSRILVSVLDITQRKQIEEALQQANKKLNMLSSITRHDILNLIMAIRGYLELSEDMVHDTELREYIEMEGEAVNAIQKQIEFTRYYQDIGVEEPKWQNVNGLISKVADQFNLGGITLDVRVPEIEIFADPLIEKVFYNLIENSLRHGEHVTIISLSCSKKESGLILYYRDDGVGITGDDRKKLFQRGVGKHTGLGLFLSREILSITGMSISEHGVPGEGVLFEIEVPDGKYRFVGKSG